MSCISCGRGILGECNCEIATGGDKSNKDSPPVAENRSPGRPKLLDEEITDPQSTGRKRAAQLWPLDLEAPCEWQFKANCGGGKHPILGCATGMQRNIHHGPDKNTLNNARDNIHKICPTCHNRWHAVNDKDYDPSIPHNPRGSTYIERVKRLTEEMGPQAKKNK